jgi:hypothetical protein
MGLSLFGGFGSSSFELYPSRWHLMSTLYFRREHRTTFGEVACVTGDPAF